MWDSDICYKETYLIYTLNWVIKKNLSEEVEFEQI